MLSVIVSARYLESRMVEELEPHITYIFDGFRVNVVVSSSHECLGVLSAPASKLMEAPSLVIAFENILEVFNCVQLRFCWYVKDVSHGLLL